MNTGFFRKLTIVTFGACRVNSLYSSLLSSIMSLRSICVVIIIIIVVGGPYIRTEL